MAEDRLRKDYDVVENLGDLIEAREERISDFADSTDAMEDIDVSALPEDPARELSYPHHHGPSKEKRLGIDVELMDTPNEENINFDWQDSAEEMLPTDPEPNEGMGVDEAMDSFSHIEIEDASEGQVNHEAALYDSEKIKEEKLDSNIRTTYPNHVVCSSL